jgi:hypothetical protein
LTLPSNENDGFGKKTLGDYLHMERPNFPASINSCESVMEWPILEQFWRGPFSFPSDAEYENFLVEEDNEILLDLQRVALDTENLGSLIKRFLLYVHAKNPVLESKELNDALERVTNKKAFGFNGEKCLVVSSSISRLFDFICYTSREKSANHSKFLAAALGCKARPFLPDTLSVETSEIATEENAQGWYFAAKRCLGLIRPSLLKAQCLFLFGLFEMYSMHAYQAWQYFHQARTQLEDIFWVRAQPRAHSEHISPGRKNLETVLYWSCIKWDW